MDICDVSSLPQFELYLKFGEKLQEIALANQGNIPAIWNPPEKHVHRFQETRARAMVKPKHKPRHMLPAIPEFFLSPYYPSTASIHDLKPTYLKELKSGVPHRGGYVLVKALTPPLRVESAIEAIVQDEKGTSIIIHLSHYPDENSRPAESVIKKNDIFLIKEPRIMVWSSTDGPALHVDHVSDLVLLGLRDELIPNQWRTLISQIDGAAVFIHRQEGDKAMDKKQYWNAIRCYTSALECNPPTDQEQIIHVQRALAYLKCGRLELALDATQREDVKWREKPLYQTCEALYELQRYSECLENLRVLREKYPDPKYTRMVARVKDRLREKTTGVYNWHSMSLVETRARPPFLDHATYREPVAVRSSPFGGQGLFTTIHVKAGQLLLCEKAFSYCYNDTNAERSTKSSRVSILTNVAQRHISVGTQADLITNIIQKCIARPTLTSKLTSLHCGSYEPAEITEVDGNTVVDAFFIERVVSLNCFGCPLTTEKNKFPAPGAERKYYHETTGLWLLAAKINHSCYSNVSRSFIGDFQIIRALRDMPPDTELTCSYRDIRSRSQDINPFLLKRWGFECDCAICAYHKESPSTIAEAQEFLNKIPRFGSLDTVKDGQMVASAGERYHKPEIEVPRFQLSEPYLRISNLCYALASQDNAMWEWEPRLPWYDRSIVMAIGVLVSLGYYMMMGPPLPGYTLIGPDVDLEATRWGLMTDDAFSAWKRLQMIYVNKLGMPGRLQECMRIAYTIYVGEDGTYDEASRNGFEKTHLGFWPVEASEPSEMELYLRSRP
ncbi:hypothetical protein HYFRA_00012226 [Hymenoscyphus fraxineus]|uniref:SET domain-containing protein n=1 Tax=Hymenoscyphus fraxineus TaxID=746836 RepID=A0A9N9L451_9HELO|nr:hypothetical protein HYFRA_00012226 [Hymenoscyphus fraxineus]